MTKLLVWSLAIGFLAATLYSHGIWPEDCLVLPGDGWVEASCSTPGAVPAEEVVESGTTGARGYGKQLSPDQIKDLWIRFGGDPAQAHMAQAVARAESAGRPLAVNESNKNGTIDRGLFQVNSVHGGCSTFDLAENVRCAVKLQQSPRGWTHWSTYNKGLHEAFL